jgi:hypothetical protein
MLLHYERLNFLALLTQITIHNCETDHCILCQAIEDLTRALEFESNTADILHERGIFSNTECFHLVFSISD